MASSKRSRRRWSLWPALLALAAQPALALEVGQPVLETVGYLGEPANAPSSAPELSSSGRYLAFGSTATNLEPTSWTSTYPHVYLRDRQTGINQRLSVDALGNNYPYISGSVIASDDGRALFNSYAPLVPELNWSYPNPGRYLTYLRDTRAGTIELVSRQSNGAPAGEAYRQGAPNFVTDEVVLHTQGTLGPGGSPFTGQAYVRNWVTGVVELVSARPDGNPTTGAVSSGTLSPSGRYVVFQSGATDLTTDNPLGQVQLFLRDRVTQTTRRLTFPYGGGEFTTPFVLISGPVFGGDDSSILFSTTSRELVANGAALPSSNVYQLDITTGVVTLESVGAGGLIPNGRSVNGRVSADGRYLAFGSSATNLTTSAYPRGVYLRDRWTDEIVNVSGPLGELEPFTSPNISISADGSTLAFSWWHPNSAPLVGNRIMIYSVAIHGRAPYAAPEPVPARSLLACLGLIALLGGIAAGRARSLAARRALGWNSPKACQLDGH